ncbi:nucleotide exchange factor GrpE [Bradyrhizobium sp. 149]|uniref:nucleotide exchange factor GrpE n=1 Tax=Bradyrhizobium sp. 149 TaxID=2782624 RepID=UPI001FFB55FF|nr:nucleotide exchange factor GrpE [Bradyrhizobium sp. 149]
MQENVTGEQAPPVEEAKERDSLQAENAALRDRLLRALADAENTRQRGERMAKDARQYAIADFARELLTVLDNLHRAIAAAEQRRADMTDDSSLLEGIKATERILTSTLERFAVRRVEALGAKFDPALHEAVMQVEDDEHDPGTVVQVLEEATSSTSGCCFRPGSPLRGDGRNEPRIPKLSNLETATNSTISRHERRRRWPPTPTKHWA